MKEIPILFSGPMVRRIRAGGKWQTRRMLKAQGADSFDFVLNANLDLNGGGVWWDGGWRGTDKINRFKCPYGAPGRRLWVRETCRAEEAEDGYDGIRYPADDAWVKIENTREAADNWLALFHYGQKSRDGVVRRPSSLTGKGVPSIHMPRWASRITLAVTGVRVERLQDITEADAIAEGIIEYEADREEGGDPAEFAWDDERGRGEVFPSAVAAYRDLWEHINGRESWEANPWVWVVEFPQQEPAHVQ